MNVAKPQPKSMFVMVILRAGLLAGILDAIAAVLAYTVKGGKNPVMIFNFIASGIFGTTAFSGGNKMAFVGLLFHLCIATIWAMLFFMASSRIKILTKFWIASGIGYGVFVWLCMNLIVVPLSNTPPIQHTSGNVFTGIVILIACIGIPIAYFTSKFRSRTTTL